MLDQLQKNIKFTKTLSVTSGKGGVGKTTLTCNLAQFLAARGNKVLILDGDLGMANVDVMFGRKATNNILDVLEGRKFIEEVIIEVKENIYLIPGGSGLHELTRLDPMHKKNLLDQVSSLNGYFDYMIIDTAPGIDSNVLYLNSAVHEIIVVVTPDPSSLTDAYALIKVLNKYHKEEKFTIVCNEVQSEEEALFIYKRLSEVTERFLCVSLDFKGFIPLDTNVVKANRRQELILDVSPYSPAAKAMAEVAEHIQKGPNVEKFKGGLQFFWEQVLGVA